MRRGSVRGALRRTKVLGPRDLDAVLQSLLGREHTHHLQQLRQELRLESPPVEHPVLRGRAVERVRREPSDEDDEATDPYEALRPLFAPDTSEVEVVEPLEVGFEVGPASSEVSEDADSSPRLTP